MAPHGGQIKRLWGKRQGFRAECRTFCQTSQHSDTQWSDGKLVRKEAEAWSGAQNRLSNQSTQCQTVVWWNACEERGRGLEQSAESSVKPVSTVPGGSLMERLWGKRQRLRAERRTVCQTSQHSATLWSDGKLWGKRLGAERRTLCQTGQHSATWWSDGKIVRKEAEA